jgi:hypothetical protein
MEAPRIGLDMKGLNAAVKAHFRQMYEDNTNDGWHCKGCGGKILFAPCNVSIHETPPGGECVGFDEVKQFPLPYCPQCEGEPTSTSTCMHVGTKFIRKAFGGLLEDTGQLELV